MSKKNAVVETEEQKKNREVIESIANNISALAKSVHSLLNGPLSEKAIVILLTNSSKMNKYQVEAVLESIANLEKDWLNKK